jgi:hypothetical protein
MVNGHLITEMSLNATSWVKGDSYKYLEVSSVIISFVYCNKNTYLKNISAGGCLDVPGTDKKCTGIEINLSMYL